MAPSTCELVYDVASLVDARIPTSVAMDAASKCMLSALITSANAGIDASNIISVAVVASSVGYLRLLGH